MKNLILSAVLATGSICAFAQNASLVVEQVNNGGIVPGNTYRVYAQVEESYTVHAVFGLDDMPAHIQTTGTFYQAPFGGATAEHLSAGLIAAEPQSEFDSFITIGENDNTLQGLWNVGTDYSNFEAGGTLTLNEATWFVQPQNESSHTQNGLIMLAQLTTDGIASGLLHIQGWDTNEEAYQVNNLTFTTAAAFIFGCTDTEAANYDAMATYDDGTCEGSIVLSVEDEAPTALNEEWSIFPNPVFGDRINIQFAAGFLENGEDVIVDIFSAAGKLVAHETLQSENVVDGNKMQFNQDLAAGLYTMQIIHAYKKHANQLLIK